MQLCEYTQILSEVQSSRFVIIDKAIVSLYPDINSKLDNKSVYYIDGPEASKNMSEYEKCIEFFIEKHISRTDYLLVIGGGATSDLGGYVAATILRGIEWRVIPTTLLAMIDASIGGKVGINSQFGKNLIGNFCEPKTIHICEHFLTTLCKTEIESGKGELLKYAFLNESIYQSVINNGFTSEVIFECAKYKQEIVKDDLAERGQRKLLNFGHTFGHVFERVNNLPHGIAVNVGIKFILEVFSTQYLSELSSLTQSLNLKAIEVKKMNFDSFWEQVLFDKKISSAQSIDLILVENIGTCNVFKWKLDDLKYEIQNAENYENYFC
jgi:3-dehydroquinate synthase